MAAAVPECALIIGTYNNAAHVAATIESVRMQVHTGWTCLIVDNGSTDDTVVRSLALIAGDSRFRLIRKANEGPSAGRNQGMREIDDGIAFVHFLDGDDVLHPHFLLQLAGYLRQRPEVGLVGCQFDVIDAQGASLGPGQRSRYAPARWGWPRALRDEDAHTPFETFFAATGQGPFALFRASVWRRTTGYEVEFWSHEDSDIFCQMAMLAPVHYLPARLYLKRVHGHNLTASPRADYSKFRNKWDRLRLSDPKQDQRLERALRYYYGRHAPLRHFKIAAKAAREFAQGQGWASLRWSLQCLGNGCADLLLRRTLRAKLAQRAAVRSTPGDLTG